jgi:hypothetical protein
LCRSGFKPAISAGGRPDQRLAKENAPHHFNRQPANRIPEIFAGLFRVISVEKSRHLPQPAVVKTLQKVMIYLDLLAVLGNPYFCT